MQAQYNTVIVTACEGGWLIKQKGKPDKVCVRWESVVLTLKTELTSFGDLKPNIPLSVKTHSEDQRR